MKSKLQMKLYDIGTEKLGKRQAKPKILKIVTLHNITGVCWSTPKYINSNCWKNMEIYAQYANNNSKLVVFYHNLYIQKVVSEREQVMTTVHRIQKNHRNSLSFLII